MAVDEVRIRDVPLDTGLEGSVRRHVVLPTDKPGNGQLLYGGQTWCVVQPRQTKVMIQQLYIECGKGWLENSFESVQCIVFLLRTIGKSFSLIVIFRVDHYEYLT